MFAAHREGYATIAVWMTIARAADASARVGQAWPNIWGHAAVGSPRTET